MKKKVRADSKWFKVIALSFRVIFSIYSQLYVQCRRNAGPGQYYYIFIKSRVYVLNFSVC